MTLGDVIRNARKDKGLTQNELASLVGVKNSSVSNWEKNQNRPSASALTLLWESLDIFPEDLMMISKSLGISMSELTGGKWSTAETMDFIRDSITKRVARTLKPDEADIIQYYRCLNDRGKRITRMSIESMNHMPGMVLDEKMSNDSAQGEKHEKE